MPDLIFPLCMALGFVLGAISGLIPGLHVNNFAAMLLAVSSVLIGFGVDPRYLAILVVAASISQTFLDAIPAIFVGAPDPDTALAVLPGHSMMLEGRGIEAVRLSALGSAGAVVVAVALAYPLAILIGTFYDTIMDNVGLLLAAIAAMMILTERGQIVEGRGSLAHLKYKAMALMLFISSGLLGSFALGYQKLATSSIGLEPQMLLPLLSGIFGASTLLLSIFTNGSIPPQIQTRFEIEMPALVKSIVFGGLAGSIVAWIPGVSPAVATVATRLGAPSSDREFLVSVSGVNTSNAILSLIALYVIGRPRSGAAAAVQELTALDLELLLQMMLVGIGVAAISYLLTIRLAEVAGDVLRSINYRLLCMGVLIGLILMCLVFTGPFGTFIFFLATVVGLIAPMAGIRKTHAMGVLMFPLMLQYLGI